MAGRISGNLYLAWRASLVWPLKALFGTASRGIEKFYENYRPEGLIPTLPHDRAMLTAAGRCISCGLCDALDPQLGALPRRVYDGASVLPRQLSRSSVDLPHAREVLSRIDPSALQRGEEACPTRVPLVAMARWLRERADRVVEPEAGGPP